MNIHPIRNDHDLERALARIDALWGSAAGTAEGDELDVLLDLVEHYEARHHPIPAGDPIDVIEYKLNELGISQRELGRRLGWGSGRVSEVLNRKRGLTLAMVQQLAEALHVDPALLVGVEKPQLPAERSIALDERAWTLICHAASQSNRDPTAWAIAMLQHAARSSIGAGPAAQQLGGAIPNPLSNDELRDLVASWVAGCRRDLFTGVGLRVVNELHEVDLSDPVDPVIAVRFSNTENIKSQVQHGPSNDNACAPAWEIRA
ncbi:MAG: helix-turn-helix domain-containing protein [Deltaproteobacteria bacterium]|nr:helix-turn-helix domain-containing protein [Deltaproteobacteria bacterium]